MQNGWIDYGASTVLAIGHRLSDFDRFGMTGGAARATDATKERITNATSTPGLYAAGLEIYTQKVQKVANATNDKADATVTQGISKGEIFYSCHYLLHNPQRG